jgi:hypothetical protein
MKIMLIDSYIELQLLIFTTNIVLNKIKKLL